MEQLDLDFELEALAKKFETLANDLLIQIEISDLCSGEVVKAPDLVTLSSDLARKDLKTTKFFHYRSTSYDYSPIHQRPFDLKTDTGHLFFSTPIRGYRIAVSWDDWSKHPVNFHFAKWIDNPAFMSEEWSMNALEGGEWTSLKS